MKYDVFGMCNALYDIQAEVSDELLSELQIEKGGMMLLDALEQQRLIPRVLPGIVNSEAGGSGANTMIGVALLGGNACFTSRVAEDTHGEKYRLSLESKGVKANLGTGNGSTGVSLILVSPDAQRTMCTYLGVGRELQPADVNLEDLCVSKYLYVTGYLWDTDSQKETVLYAMQQANKADVRVALSLSDPFCVNRHRDDFNRIISNHVDVVFGNASEAQALTGTENPDDAARALGENCDIVVITMDSHGSLIRQEDTVYEIPAYPVKAVDTTGAGDMYAAGLLFGLTQGYDHMRTGKIASWCAAQVVAKMGPRLDSITLPNL